ncbi:WD40 repeat-like protein [Mycena indigotica]|uniref:WD40 repeat-like protein n=1 Tax=Mycena indigotica TaxID=2126181 RepID=A0A8H6SAR4_9AGAR|nr:WD40 repeat-like protein [Mycena indigotica]KAF7295271.1 WD40 repeat-like protein [Mycena indigotica]
MSTAESPEYLVSEAQLELTEARRQKAERTKDIGEPIQLAGKALALQVYKGYGWLAENTTVARKMDLETGKTLQIYKGHTGPATSLAFYEKESKDYLLTGSWDKTIKVWDTTTKAMVSSTDAHSDFVKCLCVVQSLHLLISGSSDKIVRFWDLSKVEADTPLTSLGSISSHTRPIACIEGVALSASTGLLYTADTMGIIRIWDLVKEGNTEPRWKATLKTELQHHRTGITDLQLSGDRLWTASTDETAQLTVGSKTACSITHPLAVRCLVSLSELDEPYIITGSGDVIRVYDVSDLDKPELLNEIDAHWHDVTVLQLWARATGGEPWLISTSLDGTIRKWRVADLLKPRPPVPPPEVKSTKAELEFSMTEDEERELAELMDD